MLHFLANKTHGKSAMEQLQSTFFQLKADLIPLTVLKITDLTLNGIHRQLQQTIQQAPNYFQFAPILIDLTDLRNQSTLKLQDLCALLKAEKLIPVAIRGLIDEQQARLHNLAILKKMPEPQKKQSGDQASEKTKPYATKIITKPVRAGTQVYAKNGDLVILAGVNPGAECFADGCIHVYGPLRGRALAGISGDTNARIFCKSLEAELVAIAGHYAIKETIVAPSSNGGMVQVYLNQNQLQINLL